MLESKSKKSTKVKKNITIDDIAKVCSKFSVVQFDKYIRPVMNFLNSKLTASYTAPRYVGQLSSIFNEYLNSLPNVSDASIEGWKQFYLNKRIKLKSSEISGKQAFEEAINNLKKQIELLKELLNNNINDEVIRKWVDELMFNKTFEGLYLEYPIACLASKILFDYHDDKNNFNENNLRKSTPEEESKGIDYIYKDGDLILNLQIKVENIDANFLRSTSYAISQLPDDVYICEVKKIKSGIRLKITYNGNVIVDTW